MSAPEAATEAEIDALILEHEKIQKQMPSAWLGFYARFGRLRPVQLKAAPKIFNGSNALVTSPTASGKTEAVIAPLCERALREKWGPVSIIVITPTRALVNDQFQRLQRPCDQMGLTIRRKTGDHSSVGEAIKEQLLITTPESLESLLTFRKDQLKNVRAIVIDEIHLLDGSPRGDQVRLCLSRLRKFVSSDKSTDSRDLQVICLSATVPNPERMAAAYMGQRAEIVTVPGQRKIQSTIIHCAGDDEQRITAALKKAEEDFVPHKVLVFVNSRKQVDLAARYFRQGSFAHYPVYGHHGSLSKWSREQVEESFRRSERAICVATTTLEVGIDIGDVDLVICMDPPFSLSSFLQRVGRGCRRMQGLTRVLCVARDRASELVFKAIIHQASIGMPKMPLKPLRRSVLAQQILAYLRQVPKHRRTIGQMHSTFTIETEPTVGSSLVSQVLKDLEQEGYLRIHNDIVEPAAKGWDFIESLKILTNISSGPLESAIIDSETGKTIATVAGVNPSSKAVQLAGVSYDIVSSRTGVHRVRKGQQIASTPSYFVRSLPYESDVGSSLLGFLGLNPAELVAVMKNRDLLVLTWLGKAQNAYIVEALNKIGIKAKAKAFSIVLSRTDSLDLFELRKAIKMIGSPDWASEVRMEGIADLGPHMKLFSETAKAAARADWLDQDYLAQWMGGLSSIKILEQEDPLHDDVAALAAL